MDYHWNSTPNWTKRQSSKKTKRKETWQRTKTKILTDLEIKQHEISNTRKQIFFFSIQIGRIQNIPRKLCQHLKATGYSDKSRKHCNIVLNVEDQHYHDSLKVANNVNSFTTVAAVLTRNLPQPFHKYCTNTSFKNCYRNKGIVPESFDLQPVTLHFTEHELEKKLNIAKRTGQDNIIPPQFLRNCALMIASPLTHIINLSITTNTVPKELKEALVTSLHKKRK